MTQSSESISDPEFVFAHAMMRDYWIPSTLSEKIIQQLEFVHSTMSTNDESLSPLYEIVGTLIANLRSVRQFLSFPFTLAARVMDGSLKQDSSGMRMRILEKATRSDKVVDQLKLLKQQSIILIWSAYETFSRDVFVSALNERHDLYELILKSPLKERFSGNQVFSYSSLAKHGLNIETKLGAILADGKDFSSPAFLRILFAQIFPGHDDWQELKPSLESEVLWKLGHRRHLVAHRAGLVDSQYLDQTGDQQQTLGKQLVVTGDDLDEAMRHVAETALTILIAWEYVRDNK